MGANVQLPPTVTVSDAEKPAKNANFKEFVILGFSRNPGSYFTALTEVRLLLGTWGLTRLDRCGDPGRPTEGGHLFVEEALQAAVVAKVREITRWWTPPYLERRHVVVARHDVEHLTRYMRRRIRSRDQVRVKDEFPFWVRRGTCGSLGLTQVV